MEIKDLTTLDAELEEMLPCGICLELFNNGDRVPKFLNCHHSLCLMFMKVSCIWFKLIFLLFISLLLVLPYRIWKPRMFPVRPVAARPRWSSAKLLMNSLLISTFCELLKSGGLLLWRMISLSSKSSQIFGTIHLQPHSSSFNFF